MAQQTQALPSGTKIESAGPQGQFRVVGTRDPRQAPVIMPEQPSLAALAGEGEPQAAPPPAVDPKLLPYARLALQGLIGR